MPFARLASCSRLPRVCGDGPSPIGDLQVSWPAAPRMRGWTPRERRRVGGDPGCPAYAGMDPPRPAARQRGCGLLRVCGDGPLPIRDAKQRPRAAPRMRGWTARNSTISRAYSGCPAYAGMDPTDPDQRCQTLRLPRVCGDGPLEQGLQRTEQQAAPRMRGWTRRTAGRRRARRGCPAYAGMDPQPWTSHPRRMWLPRVCGDGPGKDEWYVYALEAAPRMRGWTQVRTDQDRAVAGCPAYAGMDPAASLAPAQRRGLPRVCGDGPCTLWSDATRPEAAPRMRGWTLGREFLQPAAPGCPAYAGMDPR